METKNGSRNGRGDIRDQIQQQQQHHQDSTYNFKTNSSRSSTVTDDLMIIIYNKMTVNIVNTSSVSDSVSGPVFVSSFFLLYYYY